MLCENCIVDASIKHALNGLLLWFVCVCLCDFFFFNQFFVKFTCVATRIFVVWVVCVFVIKGAWWMPWHAEPMKDVKGCVKPRGVVN